MNGEIIDALQKSLLRLTELVRSDAALRSNVERLANGLLALARDGAPTATEPGARMPEPALDAPPAEVTQPARQTEPAYERPTEGIAAPPLDGRITFHAAAPDPRVIFDTAWPRATPAVVETREAPERIAARCRLMQQAAELVAQRALAGYVPQTHSADEEQLLERERMLSRHAPAGWSVWMLHAGHLDGLAPESWSELARCYAALADAWELLDLALRLLGTADPGLLDVLLLVSEAQSMLRIKADDMDREREEDQLITFRWLKSFASEKRFFIPRFMKLDDPATPADADGLRLRIAATRDAIEGPFRNERERKQQLGKLRYHADRVRRSPEDDHAHDWQTIVQTVDRLVSEGLYPSSVELRQHLLPIFNLIPDTLDHPPENFERVLCEIDRYLNSRPSDEEAAAAPSRIEHVREVARVLKGRTIVFIGGDEREPARRKLVEAFELDGLRWVETREDNTRIDFEHEFAREDVAIVLLATRWIRHALNEARELARRHGKLLVQLPGGYNPNRVAYDIVAQCGHALGLNR